MTRPSVLRRRSIRPRRPGVFGTLAVAAEIIGVLLQLQLIWIGGRLLWGSEDPERELIMRLSWCLLATIYLGFTIAGLAILVHRDRPDPRVSRILIGHPLTRLLSTVLSLGATFIGLTVALDLIIELGSEHHDPLSLLSAVGAMLLSWSIFNWGYARIYFSRYHRSQQPPLLFPGTPEPRLTDFVYLAFTNATTFAVSDVQVVSSRMRWTIVWHTSIAFFFNALIIALTLNVVTNGKLLAGMFLD